MCRARYGRLARTATVELPYFAVAAAVYSRGMRGLVGGGAERERLLEHARRGGLVLVGGEAGVGKPRLLAELDTGGAPVLRGAGMQTGPPPYGPLAAALRGYLRTEPDGLADSGRL